MALQSRNVIANAVGKKLILSETIKCFFMGLSSKGAGVPLFPNFQHWAVRRLSCIQRCCMYWDRPLTVLLLIFGPPQMVNSSLMLTGMFISTLLGSTR